MNDLKEIVYRTRQTGNTTWILKAAIKMPECVIVSKNMQQAKGLENEYRKMLLNESWWRKLYWKYFGKKHPKFLSVSSRFEGMRLPIIFDNGALC
jgi:hypothetical protein